MGKIDKEILKNFYKAVLTLKNEEECEKFFDDACTVQEIEAIAQRFHAACLLYDGKSYVDVNNITGISTATISRVNKCINYGDGGYKTVIERLRKDKNKVM